MSLQVESIPSKGRNINTTEMPRSVLPSIIIALLLTACAPEHPFCASVTDVPEVECWALLDFYETTDGPNWKDHRGWLDTPHVCEWFGITCTSGHVTSLAMNYVDLAGEIPPSLAQLEHLQVISLYYNHLSGSIPPELGTLEDLQVLILHNNQLSGAMPVELGNLRNLRLLDLDSNRLTGSIPPEYGALAHLEDLKLRNNRLSGQLPPELGNLAQLRGLWLSHNDFSGEIPAEFVNMSNLRMFSAYGNHKLGPLPFYLARLPPDGYPSWANPGIP